MKKVLTMVGVVVVIAIISVSCGETGNKAKEATKNAAEKVEKKAEAVKEKAEAAVKAVLGNADHGKEIYDNKCMACHMTGVTGAPKMDEKERWAKIASQGLDVVYSHALKGFTGKQGNMPPKGGFSDLSDSDVKDAVTYMLKTSGAK